MKCSNLSQLGAFALVIMVACWMAGCGSPYKHVANLDTSGTGIICFGDSITRGQGATRGNDYPSRLSALLGMPVVNAGVNGDTTASALRRLDRDVLRAYPRLVIVELGGNDYLRKVPKAETLENLEAIVAGCVSGGAMVVVLHAKIGLFSDPYWDGVQEIAARQGAFVIENVLKDIFGNPARMSDQVHPNDLGYAVVGGTGAVGGWGTVGGVGWGAGSRGMRNVISRIGRIRPIFCASISLDQAHEVAWWAKTHPTRVALCVRGICGAGQIFQQLG